MIDIDGLYRSHAQMVLRRARSILGDAAAADDVLQEVFSALLSRPEQFEGRSKPSTYLYAVTTHLCLRRLRDQKNRARLVSLRLQPDVDGAVAAATGDRVALLRQLLERLPAELAEVAVYFFVDSLTYDEIAQVLGCSRRHVADLLQRFREAASNLVREPQEPAATKPVSAEAL